MQQLVRFRRTKGKYNESIKNNWKQFCSPKCLILNRTKSQEVTCKQCGKNFIKSNYQLKKFPNSFCSTSCAAKYNNKNKIMSSETKKKISDKLKGRKCPRPKKIKSIKPKIIKPDIIVKCKVCGNIFYIKSNSKYKRKTCSRECQTISSTKIRAYQNGSRKTIWYFNPFENKKVLLESSWEVKVADLLCAYNIFWIRPEPLTWIDNNNKKHLYFPDFFLPQHNVYLDPKNPYCMDRDKEKMKYFENKINLVYGKLSVVTDYVEKFGREEGLRSLDPCAPNAVL